jgi:MFS family permease
MRIITRKIWLLGFISLFTDMASEMLYPVMPVYLQSIGYSIVVIGIIEGFAEAIAGLSKGYFGNLSDSIGKRVPFVKGGYALSAISKPLMAMFTSAWWIFLARSIDRVGKGIRTGARDAMLSETTISANRGTVFGFHRAMDTAGAIVGPVIALCYLNIFPAAYRELFLIAFIPGVFAVAITFMLSENKIASKLVRRSGILSFVKYPAKSSAAYRKVFVGLLVFALVNSSDVFLLLRMKDNGATDTQVIGIYIFYNLVYALSAYPIGILADRVGLKKMIVAGLFLFAIAYGGMAFATTQFSFLVLFVIYGIYAAATEGISKALISNISPKNETATAIGTFTAFQSVASMLASFLAGWIWYTLGPQFVFIYAAIVSTATALYFLFLRLNIKFAD